DLGPWGARGRGQRAGTGASRGLLIAARDVGECGLRGADAHHRQQRGNHCNERRTPSESRHFKPPPRRSDPSRAMRRPAALGGTPFARWWGPDEGEEDRAMAKRQKRSEQRVQDIMVEDVVSIEPAASLTDAARAMEEANVGMLPVVQDGRVPGVITDRDIVVRAVARAADPAAIAVGDCLSINAIVAHPDWSTEQAMQ